MRKGKHDKVLKREVSKKLGRLCIFALIASFATLYSLTPSIREITFVYAGCGYTATKTDIENRKISTTFICLQKNSNEETSANLKAIIYKEDISQRLGSSYIPFINAIRFKFEITNKSISRAYSNIDQDRIIETTASVVCEQNGKKKVIPYGEQLPSYALNEEFLSLSNMEAYYTTLEEKIHDHCGFVGEPLEYKIQVRSSTSTPVLKDAFWVGNAGEHINVKTTLFETYKVKLRPDSVNYLILIPIFFFVPGLALKSYRENIKSFIK